MSKVVWHRIDAAARTKRREPWMLGDEITQNMRDQAWHVLHHMASNANGSGWVTGQCAISDDAVLVLQGSKGTDFGRGS